MLFRTYPCKTYAGNRTDDTTHVETWDTLRNIHGSPDFLYVADSKLCTDSQLNHIVMNDGRAITIMPQTWRETSQFKDALRAGAKRKSEIWRRIKPGSSTEQPVTEYFSNYKGEYRTEKRNFRVHWIHSSEKSIRDRATREEFLLKAERKLLELNVRINTRKLKTQEQIKDATDDILSKNKVSDFITVDIGVVNEEIKVQIGRGRPNENTLYRKEVREIYTMTWRRLTDALKRESRVDGVFPLLCTDEKLDSKEVLQSYKYQPRLEKRFSQFKSIQNAAPILFKKIERVEANMFAFFIALMIQALIERQTRFAMEEKKIPALAIYPEDRDSAHPTTAKIMNIFSDISTYKLCLKDRVVEEYRDDLTDTHQGYVRNNM